MGWSLRADKSDHAASSPVDGDSLGLNGVGLRAYEDARMSGLCHEGALEVALGAMRADSASDAEADRADTVRTEHGRS